MAVLILLFILHPEVPHPTTGWVSTAGSLSIGYYKIKVVFITSILITACFLLMDASFASKISQSVKQAIN